MRYSGYFIGLLVGLLALTLGHAAAADGCDRTGQVSGWIKTTSLTPLLQYGTTEVTITAKNGKTLYSNQGVIIGQVDPSDNTRLDHSVFFADGTRLETTGDRVISFVPVSDCLIEVTELITDVWANRKLKRLSNDRHEVYAKGTLDFCGPVSENKLELSGIVCID